MKIKASAIIAASLLALVAQSAGAAVVGYLKATVPANADVRLSIPLNQVEHGTFTAASVDAPNSTLTVDGDPFAEDEWAGAYYVRFITGDGEGLWSTIVGNGTGDLVLSDTDVLSHVSATDTFRIYKHHTLGSLLPAGLKGVSFNADTTILLFVNNRLNMQQNPSAARVAYWNDDDVADDGQVWEGFGVDNDTIIAPETTFIIRNDSDDELAVIMPGNVPDYSVSLLVADDGDLNIGSGYPVAIKLKDAGLGGEDRAVLFYENGTAGFDKSAWRTAYYDEEEDSLWGGYMVDGDQLINPGETITLRLPSGDTGTKVTIPMPYALP
ncbi:MAG: TIGR02597 family protein [Planctomycetes bacterium]|nr:TIGR02597 family protein [Planctomycetota bacterium]